MAKRVSAAAAVLKEDLKTIAYLTTSLEAVEQEDEKEKSGDNEKDKGEYAYFTFIIFKHFMDCFFIKPIYAKYFLQLSACHRLGTKVPSFFFNLYVPTLMSSSTM